VTPSNAVVPSHSIPEYGSTDISPTTSDLSAQSLRPDAESISDPSTRLSVLQILGDPLIQNVLVSCGFLALTSHSSHVIFALWLFLPIDDGGLGLSVRPCTLIAEIKNTTYTDHSHPK
jgi:hypothetical protein